MQNLAIAYDQKINGKVSRRLAYGIPEIAEALGVSENFLRQDENLLKRKFKGRILVLAEDLEAYLSSGSIAKAA